jgi:hypothetical protein
MCMHSCCRRFLSNDISKNLKYHTYDTKLLTYYACMFCCLGVYLPYIWHYLSRQCRIPVMPTRLFNNVIIKDPSLVYANNVIVYDFLNIFFQQNIKCKARFTPVFIEHNVCFMAYNILVIKYKREFDL